MNIKRITALILCAVLSLGMMFSCGSKEKITMATNATFPPFEYITSEEKALIDVYSGVDIEIALEIAKDLGKELAIENMEFSSVLLAVPSGKADFALAGMSIKPDRLETMDFSIPYFVAQQVIITKADNDKIKSSADILKLKVGVIEGYTGETVCRDTLKIPAANLLSFKNSTDVINELKQGKIDCVVIDLHTAVAFVAKNADLKTVQDTDVFEKEEYAIAVKKGNTELLDKINATLTRLLDAGQINEWADKHQEAMKEDAPKG